MPLSRRPSLARGGRDGGGSSSSARGAAASTTPSSVAFPQAFPQALPEAFPQKQPSSGLARFFSTRKSRAAAAAANSAAPSSTHGRSASLYTQPSASGSAAQPWPRYDPAEDLPIQHITRLVAGADAGNIPSTAPSAPAAPPPRISHKGSRSVPLIDLTLRQPPEVSEAAPAAPAASTASTPRQPRPQHARSRTNSLAGRFGALFGGADDPAADATPVPTPPMSGSHASASHASVRSQSSSGSGVAALSQRVRRLSLGRRAHTSAGSTPPLPVDASPSVASPLNAQQQPATAPLRQTARMGGPARKLSLRLRGGARGADAPPRTPEIEAWKPKARHADDEQGQEIAVLARNEVPTQIRAAPLLPSWRKPPPPRFLDTPDLVDPIDARALLHEAGVLSDHGSARASVESKARAQSRRSNAARTVSSETHGSGAASEPRNGDVSSAPSRAALVDAGRPGGFGLGIEHDLDDGQHNASQAAPPRDEPSPEMISTPTLLPPSNPEASASYLSVPFDSTLDLTRRPYSLISTDGGDTPIMRLRRLVVSTTEGEGETDEALFFRPPRSAASSLKGKSSFELKGKSSTDVLEAQPPFDPQQFREHWEKRSSQAGRSSSPPPLSPLSPPPPDERRDSVLAGSLHSKRASTAASKRASAQGSEAGATDVSALGAEVSQARRMAAVPMGTARVAEWTRRTARRNSNPALQDGREMATTAQMARSLSLRDTSSAAHSHSSPPSQAHPSLAHEALAEAARLGKAPSKRVRRSKSTPMDSTLNVPWTSAAAPAPPPVPVLDTVPSQPAPKSPRRRLARLPAATAPSPARTLRASQSGNLRAVAAQSPPEKVASALPEPDAVAIPAAPRSTAPSSAGLSTHEPHSKGSIRSASHSRPPRPSFATSEEAALARRREQAERERRRAERERQREEKRLAAYASKKLNDPLLATRLALVGLADAETLRSPTREKPSVEEAHAPQAPKTAPVPDWELRQEPFRSVSISSGPYTTRKVQLAPAPSARRGSETLTVVAAQARSSSPARPPFDSPRRSHASFHTATEAASDDNEEGGDVLGLAARGAAASVPPATAPATAIAASEHSASLDSPAKHSLASPPEGFTSLEWPVPPSRSTHPQTSDDGTLLARPGLRTSGGTELSAWTEQQTPVLATAMLPAPAIAVQPQQQSPPNMLSLAGITRPISGRLVASPERAVPLLVTRSSSSSSGVSAAAAHAQHLLASPALRSERASVVSLGNLSPGVPDG